jgi:hypothetical protein
VASIKKRPDGKYRARYKEPDGNWRARHFDKKQDAVAFLEEIATQKNTNTYVRPDRAKLTVGE